MWCGSYSKIEFWRRKMCRRLLQCTIHLEEAQTCSISIATRACIFHSISLSPLQWICCAFLWKKNHCNWCLIDGSWSGSLRSGSLTLLLINLRRESQKYKYHVLPLECRCRLGLTMNTWKLMTGKEVSFHIPRWHGRYKMEIPWLIADIIWAFCHRHTPITWVAVHYI